MRLLSLLTAALVAVALYGIVFERERLLSFAGRGQGDTAEAETAAAPEPDTTDAEPAPSAAAQSENTSLVSVVTLFSTASVIDNAINLRGQTEAARSIEVRAETGGLVISDPLRAGATVQRGDVLCEIDPGTRPAALTEAEARLAEAVISNTAASTLAQGGFGSETRAAAAEATLQAAQAAVEIAKREIARLTITAPFEGILETDSAELGSLMQAGSLCAEVIQLDPIKIVGFLPETAVDEVHTGSKATARLGSGREVDGTVRFLARSADPDTRTFRVEIEVENADQSIRDGQTADISIAADGVESHLIPASALTLNDSGTMGLRIVDDEDVVQFVPVRVVRDTTDGVMLTGLPDEARVIVVGQEFVTQGVKVNPVAREGTL